MDIKKLSDLLDAVDAIRAELSEAYVDLLKAEEVEEDHIEYFRFSSDYLVYRVLPNGRVEVRTRAGADEWKESAYNSYRHPRGRLIKDGAVPIPNPWGI